MPAKRRVRGSTMELGVETRKQLARILRRSSTLSSMVGAIRAITREYDKLLEQQIAAETEGGELWLARAAPGKGQEDVTMTVLHKLDLRL